MSTKLYVGNLDFKVTDDQLKEHFGQAGEVVGAEVVVKPMGFGFVEMKTLADAKAAIEKLNESDFQGRRLKVELAKTEEEKEKREKPKKEAKSAAEESAEEPAPEAPVEEPQAEEVPAE